MKSLKITHHPGNDGAQYSTVQDEIESLRTDRTSLLAFRTALVGMVAAWPIATPPTGWLECDGSAISRTTYATLFGIIGTAYGAGNGSTTFNLPNYKDYFLRGFDSSGTDAASRTDRGDGTTGASVGTKQASDYLAHVHASGTLSAASGGAHTHDVINTTNIYSAGNVSAVQSITSGGSTNGTAAAASSGAHTHTMTGSTASMPASGGAETRSKNITVKWCMFASP